MPAIAPLVPLAWAGMPLRRRASPPALAPPALGPGDPELAALACGRDGRGAMAHGVVAGCARWAAESSGAGRRDRLRGARWLRTDASIERLRGGWRRPRGTRGGGLSSGRVREGRALGRGRRRRRVDVSPPCRRSRPGDRSGRSHTCARGNGGRGRVELGEVRRGDRQVVFPAPRLRRGGLASSSPRRVGSCGTAVERLCSGLGAEGASPRCHDAAGAAR